MSRFMHILMVEDEELDIIAIQRAFARYSVPYALTATRNGAEALDFLRGTAGADVLHDSLLILLDINMPRMNGIEFLRELRADFALKHLPVFVLTTSDEQRDVQTAYTLGISGYVLKQNVGGDFEKLIALLESYEKLVLLPHR